MIQYWNEKKFAFYFLLSLVSLALFWHFTKNYPTPVRLSAIGGLIAFFGVALMALPVLRVGPFKWIYNLSISKVIPNHEKGISIYGKKHEQDELKKTKEQQKMNEEEIRNFDLLIQNIIGPYLIGIGTVINGFSGFFK